MQKSLVNLVLIVVSHIFRAAWDLSARTYLKTEEVATIFSEREFGGVFIAL